MKSKRAPRTPNFKIAVDTILTLDEELANVIKYEGSTEDKLKCVKELRRRLEITRLKDTWMEIQVTKKTMDKQVDALLNLVGAVKRYKKIENDNSVEGRIIRRRMEEFIATKTGISFTFESLWPLCSVNDIKKPPKSVKGPRKSSKWEQLCLAAKIGRVLIEYFPNDGLRTGESKGRRGSSTFDRMCDILFDKRIILIKIGGRSRDEAVKELKNFHERYKRGVQLPFPGQIPADYSQNCPSS